MTWSSLKKWIVPERRPGLRAELERERARGEMIEIEVGFKTEKLNRILEEITERKRGQNDA